MKKILSISHNLLLHVRFYSFKIGNYSVSTLPIIAALLIIQSKFADKIIQ